MIKLDAIITLSCFIFQPVQKILIALIDVEGTLGHFFSYIPGIITLSDVLLIISRIWLTMQES